MPCRTACRGRAKSLICGLILCGLLILSFQSVARANRSVTLVWSRSTAPNAAGYKIYYGTASHVYSNVVDAGNATMVTISGLVEGRTYYFAAATYDSAGDESTYSNEASYAVPVTPPGLSSVFRSAGSFSFNIAGVAGYKYVVQASTNLANWTSVQTNASPFAFTDTNAGRFNRRFYRVFYLPQ